MAATEIIIPSTVEFRRSKSLHRAIRSVLDSQDVDAGVLLVANGDRIDEKLLMEVSRYPEVRIIRERRGSLPLAQRIGRENVQSPYFGFLDDDDELLPGALASSMEAFRREPATDVVVCNGFKEAHGERSILFFDIEKYQADPLCGLLERNWLASCGGLYKTATVGPDIWDPDIKYFEWTAVAFKLAVCGYKIKFCNKPCFVIHDTESSLSKSIEFELAAPGVWVKLLHEYTVPPNLRCRFEAKMADLHHYAALRLLSSGSKRAWHHNWMSMRLGGLRWRYFKTTAMLLIRGAVKLGSRGQKM